MYSIEKKCSLLKIDADRFVIAHTHIKSIINFREFMTYILKNTLFNIFIVNSYTIFETFMI